MKALVIGFGHVGQKLAEILFLEKEKYPELSSLNLTFPAIYTRSRGALLDPQGIDVSKALFEIRKNGRFPERHSSQPQMELSEAIDQLEYDILIELSTLSIEEHGEPAKTYIQKALSRGKHVVTANKGPVAFSFSELAELAKQKKVQFLFESTVMDGTPVFNLAKHALKGAVITGISGILTSTTNYILSQLEMGKSFQEAIRFAQSEGFAEADPQHDVDGWDSAAKVAALANVFMRANMTPYDVERKGISGIDIDTIRNSKRSGECIKLVCRAWQEDHRVLATVRPEKITITDTFSTVTGTGACLKIESDLLSPLYIIQDSPTVNDTAFGVINDILAIKENQQSHE